MLPPSDAATIRGRSSENVVTQGGGSGGGSSSIGGRISGADEDRATSRQSFELDMSRLKRAKDSDFVYSPSAHSSRLSPIYSSADNSSYLWHSTKEVVTGSKLNVLILLSPFAWLADKRELGDSIVFILALLSIAPFAERLGYVTEQLAMHTNETIGGLLNATFGNATELIISFFALARGSRSEPVDDARSFRRLVLVSLLGSMLSNTLLVFGSAIIVGGLRVKVQRFSKAAASVNTGLLWFCSGTLIFPVLFSTGRPGYDNSEGGILGYSRFCSAVLLFLYCFFLLFQLRTHRYLFDDSAPEIDQARTNGEFTLVRKSSDAAANFENDGLQENGDRASLGQGGDGQTLQDCEAADDDDEEDELILGWWTAIAWLALISICISILSEFLVNAVEGAAVSMAVPESFIAGIIIPIVGNACEHLSALVFAYRNKMDLAVGIALGSAVQIGLFVLPVCVVAGPLFNTPLDLLVKPFEAGALFVAVLVVAVVVKDAVTHWLYGVILVALYMVLGGGFWFF